MFSNRMEPSGTPVVTITRDTCRLLIAPKRAHFVLPPGTSLAYLLGGGGLCCLCGQHRVRVVLLGVSNARPAQRAPPPDEDLLIEGTFNIASQMTGNCTARRAVALPLPRPLSYRCLNTGRSRRCPHA